MQGWRYWSLALLSSMACLPWLTTGGLSAEPQRVAEASLVQLFRDKEATQFLKSLCDELPVRQDNWEAKGAVLWAEAIVETTPERPPLTTRLVFAGPSDFISVLSVGGCPVTVISGKSGSALMYDPVAGEYAFWEAAAAQHGKPKVLIGNGIWCSWVGRSGEKGTDDRGGMNIDLRRYLTWSEDVRDAAVVRIGCKERYKITVAGTREGARLWSWLEVDHRYRFPIREVGVHRENQKGDPAEELRLRIKLLAPDLALQELAITPDSIKKAGIPFHRIEPKSAQKVEMGMPPWILEFTGKQFAEPYNKLKSASERLCLMRLADPLGIELATMVASPTPPGPEAGKRDGRKYDEAAQGLKDAGR